MEQPYLQKYYRETIVPALMKSRGYGNVHQVPHVEKVVLNTGFKAGTEKGAIEDITKEIGRIAGQRPVVTKARKSVSNFKLREGMPIGVKVTLRGATMYDFLYRMIAVALPGIRDFRGVRDRFDGNGNYTLGISDHSIFPEAAETGKLTIGMDICVSTTAASDDEGRELLQQLGVPFRKRTAGAAGA